METEKEIRRSFAAAHGSAERGCCNARRHVVKAMGALSAVVLLGSSWRAASAAELASDDSRPQSGDRLLRVDAEGVPRVLRASDVPLDGKPVRAVPYDPAAAIVRDGSRLNRLLLLRFAADELATDVRGRCADGVMAYSAICTHQGCEVSEYEPAHKTLLCFCHFSKFEPLNAGQVVAGPAPRNLPSLPLALGEEGELIVAGPFSALPGVKKI